MERTAVILRALSDSVPSKNNHTLMSIKDKMI